MPGTGHERAKFKPVIEDLEHLEDVWSHGPKDEELRRGSVILRGFFCDNLLQLAWKSFGFEREPVVVAPNLDLLLGADRSNIEVALAGGADAPGVYAAGFVIARDSKPGRQPESTFECDGVPISAQHIHGVVERGRGRECHHAA